MTEPPPLFIGIDPGKKGGLVGLKDKSVFYTKMPTTEKEIWSWIRALYKCRPASGCKCFIEWINPGMIGSGKSSMSKLFGSYMQLRGFLVAANIPFQTVMPHKWQKTLGIAPRNKKTETQGMWKDRLVNEARKLFPKLPIWKGTASVQRAIADALLIAHYCKTQHTKEQT